MYTSTRQAGWLFVKQFECDAHGHFEPDTVTGQRWTACPGCAVKLPLRLSEEHENAALWRCLECERPFAGVFEEKAERRFANRVRLADAHFDVSSRPPISDEMRLAVAKLSLRRSPTQPSVERRPDRRIILGFDAVAVEADSVFCPTGDPRRVMVRDISASGVGFVTDSVLNPGIVAIEMAPSDKRLQLIGDVKRCEEIAPSVFDVGVNFRLRLG